MIFHDSHEISYLIFFRKLGKMSQNFSSAAIVIGALRVKKELVLLLRLKVVPYGTTKATSMSMTYSKTCLKRQLKKDRNWFSRPIIA